MRLLRSRRRRRRHQRGFTLVELMVSLVLFSFAIAGVLAVAVAMANGFREQRATIGTEGATRSAMDFLTEAVRSASPGVPSGNVQVYHLGCPPGPGWPSPPIQVVNNSAGVTSNAGTDELLLTFAYGSVVTSTTAAFGDGDGTLTVENYEELAQGDMLLVTDLASQGTLVEISAPVTGNTLTISAKAGGCGLTFPNGGTPYPPRSVVIRALRARFFVLDLNGIPTLWMDPDAEGPAAAEPLAEGIEDMQIALAIDEANAGDPAGDTFIGDEVGAAGDDDDWVYNHAADLLPVGMVRAVRITLIARASGQATGVARFFRPGAEDRAAAVTLDKFRRRVLSSTIETRNLAGSP